MPRQRYTSRKLEVYKIQAHFGRAASDAVNYQKLFQQIAFATRAQRTVNVLGKSIGLPDFRVDDDLVVLTAYEGEEGNPLFYNFLKGTERIEELAVGEKLARKTHAVISIPRREAIIEYNQRGAKAADIAEAIQEIGRSLTTWRDLEVNFTPVTDQSFVQAIDNFQRIRSATMKMVRPNADWTDYATYFTDLAGESKGGSVEVTINAQRGQSLNRSKGLIDFIKKMVTATFPSLKSAKLVGTRKGEEAETTVSMANHIAHQKVAVEVTDEGHVDEPELNDKLVRFLEAREPRNRK
jgi:hypothetical protein